jgi:hypothetical protein
MYIVAREQLGKQVPAKKNSWPTIGKVLSIARQRSGKHASTTMGGGVFRGVRENYLS